jgi:hypothetical protein
VWQAYPGFRQRRYMAVVDPEGDDIAEATARELFAALGGDVMPGAHS